MYKFIDLFCGIGGFRVALQKNGLECVYSCDIDKDVQSAYYKNFNEKPEGDITQISEKRIPKHDILCAGFPCQSFSIAGKMNGMKIQNGRLFYEIVRIAQYHKPIIMLLENVKNILSIEDGRVIETIRKSLDEIGYELQQHNLNASHFGVPQARERIYFVCIRKDHLEKNKNNTIFEYSPPKATNKKIYLEDILEKDVDKNLFINRNDIVINKEVINRALRPLRVGHINKGAQWERIYSPLGHAITICGGASRTGLYKVDNGIRKLSINECKLIMGFKKNHYVSENSKGYKQLGNAVIPKMIDVVWRSIKIF